MKTGCMRAAGRTADTRTPPSPRSDANRSVSRNLRSRPEPRRRARKATHPVMRGGRGGVVSPCGQPSRESTPPYAAINAANRPTSRSADSSDTANPTSTDGSKTTPSTRRNDGNQKSNVPDVYPMAKHPKNKRAESLKFRPFSVGPAGLEPRPAAASPRSSNHAGRSTDAATTSSQPSGSAIPTPGSKRSTTRSRSPSAWPTASATRTTSSP